MKNMTLFRPLILLLAIVSFVSCDNEPLEGEFEATIPSNPNNDSNYTFKAVIDGEEFIADGALAITLINGELVQTSISGTSIDGTSISVAYIDNTTGTFELSDPSEGDGYAMYSILNGQEAPYSTMPSNSTGSLEVKDYDEDGLLVSGTFSFQAEREVELEDGSTEIEIVSITEGEFEDVPLTISQ